MGTIFKTLVAFLAVIATFFSSGLGQLKTKGDISGFADTVAEQKVLRDFYTDENGDFTVLQFSDTHLTTCLSLGDISILNNMEAQIKQYSPDLVVIAGDMLDDGDSGAFNKKYVLDTVCQMFEDNSQYWAYVPGNNDGRNYGSCADVGAYLSQQSEYCLVADDKDISGGTQYSIDIRDGEEKLVHSLIFIDTMDYDREDSDHIYGYVHADQVEWCEKEIAKKKAENENVKISVFQHENTPNFARAAASGETYKSGYPTIARSAEKYNIPKNQPLDDVYEGSGCVGLVSIGHVHPATCQCSYYNGTYYHITARANVMNVLITIHTEAQNSRDMYDFQQLSVISAGC